jgi:hypothetical protein
VDDKTMLEIVNEIGEDDFPDWGPKPDPAGVIEWLDNPRFFERPGILKTRLGRLRVLFRWYVMDRLRYLGLWPRRPHPSHYGKLPSGTIWGDLWRRASR